jgi:predicted HAD superfamily Cof-like phosphohydrolase
MRGKKHSDDTRGPALAALLSGQGIQEVAKQYKLPESTVRDLKKTVSSEEFAEVRAKKEEQLASLIESHLHASLEAAAAIASQASNAEWRNKQDADKLGVFYGILTDKSVRILEAAESAAPVEEEWPEHV